MRATNQECGENYSANPVDGLNIGTLPPHPGEGKFVAAGGRIEDEMKVIPPMPSKD